MGLMKQQVEPNLINTFFLWPLQCRLAPMILERNALRQKRFALLQGLPFFRTCPFSGLGLPLCKAVLFFKAIFSFVFFLLLAPSPHLDSPLWLELQSVQLVLQGVCSLQLWTLPLVPLSQVWVWSLSLSLLVGSASQSLRIPLLSNIHCSQLGLLCCGLSRKQKNWIQKTVEFWWYQTIKVMALAAAWSSWSTICFPIVAWQMQQMVKKC